MDYQLILVVLFLLHTTNLCSILVVYYPLKKQILLTVMTLGELE